MRILGSTRLHTGTIVALLGTVACGVDQATDGGPIEQPVPPASLGRRNSVQAADRFVVRLASQDVSTASVVASRVGATVERTLGGTGFIELSGLAPDQVDRLRADPAVTGVQPDLRQRWVPPFSSVQLANTTPVSGVAAQGTDQSGAAFFPIQWNIRRVRAPDGWRVTPGGSGALVCILDTGIDATQQDLLGRVDLSKSASMIAAEPFLEDLHFHGTYVASIVTSNGIGVASVAPDADLCAVKVLDQTGFGSFFDLATGIVFAAEQGADVISMSLSGVVDVDSEQGRFLMALLEAAARHATDRGSLLVAAAGNDGANLDFFPRFKIVPAQLRLVVGVSATAPFNQSNFDAFAPYSNSGRQLVGLTAPGGDLQPGGLLEDLIIGACSQFVCPDDGFYIFASGTSGAAPHVAAGGAVVESAKAGDQDGATLTTCLTRGAKFVQGLTRAQQGAGRLTVTKAVAAAC